MARSEPLPPADKKAAYVRAMFADIARRYDVMNRLMTLGRDQSWRRYTVSQLCLDAPLGTTTHAPGQNRLRGQSKTILDVATGTGDLAIEVRRQYPDVRVVGLDVVPDMLVRARDKAGRPVPVVVGDALALPFPDAVFDGVVTGFALRNVTDIPAAFAEMARVTRPGGRLACLEITRPQIPVFRHLFGWYFYRLVPIIGGIVSGKRSAYTYLPHSLTSFPGPHEIAGIMHDVGWRDVTFRRLTLGTVAVHIGVKGPLSP
ncbi:MAG: ubiquinone/menaquinone biosynthesis methyltransferase [Anaerolineae bacterium]|nr:ubiquinone/menaquinone biosynthesis methyltransferase [Anaerolineae bacterium]